MRLIATVLLLIALLATPAAAERRVALVIGNGDYSSVPALANPRADAEAMATALRRVGFEVELGVDLDLQGMRHTVQNFARKLEGADVALFFYAGHGMQVYGQNYLLPVDAVLETEADLDFSAFPARLVVAQMERWPSVKIVILDACRDNPFEKQLTRSMGRSRAARALSRGLAPIETAGGTLLAYATDPGDVAADGDGRHSPFTQALLKHVEQPGVEINTMLARVRADVYRATDQRQRPWTETSLIGEFYLVPKAPEPPPVTEAMMAPRRPAPAPGPHSGFDARAIELALWEAAQAGGTVADYQEYLRQYPEGIFAGIAQNRIAALQIAEADGPAPGQQVDTGNAVAKSEAADPAGSGAPDAALPGDLAVLPPSGSGGVAEEPAAAGEAPAGGAPSAGADGTGLAGADGANGEARQSENGSAAAEAAAGAAAQGGGPEVGSAAAATGSPDADDGDGTEIAALPGSADRTGAGESPDPAAQATKAEAALGLGPDARREVQARLMLAGHDPGGIDGIFGPGTRAALSSWQAAAGLAPTGYLDATALARLERGTDAEYAAWAERQRREAEARRAAAERERTARREPKPTAVRAAPAPSAPPLLAPSQPYLAAPTQQSPRAPAPVATTAEPEKDAPLPRDQYEQECYFVFTGSPQLERRCEDAPSGASRLGRRR